MKVILFNGSPNQNGCTNEAMEHMAKVLAERDIELSLIHI